MSTMLRLVTGTGETVASVTNLIGIIGAMIAIVCAHSHLCQMMAFAKTQTTSPSATGTGEIVATMTT